MYAVIRTDYFCCQSQYCQKVKPKFVAISKSNTAFDKPVTVDFLVDSQGKIEKAALSDSSEGTADSKALALEKVRTIKMVAAPPAGITCPFWLSADLCNQLEKVSVSFRDID